MDDLENALTRASEFPSDFRLLHSAVEKFEHFSGKGELLGSDFLESGGGRGFWSHAIHDGP
ncbi:MAG: hypothetical protein ABFD89_10035 [Bryobacteraceae bacterium]